MRRTNGKSGVLGGFCIALVLILLVGGFGYVTQGFKNWDAKTWFRPAEELPPAMDENGEAMTGGTVYKMPAQLRFGSVSAMSAATDGIRISATVEPANAPDKSVDWLVEWGNPEDEFAAGKTVTEYVTATPDSDGSNVATVKCLKAFSGTILVTVQTRVGQFRASCVVNFIGKPDHITITPTGAAVANNYVNTDVGSTYDFPITMSNLWGQVGSQYCDYSVSVEGVGFYKVTTVTFNNSIMRGIVGPPDGTVTYNLSSEKSKYIAVSIVSGKVHIEAKGAYESIYRRYTSLDGLSVTTTSYSGYIDGLRPYYKITVTEASSGLSTVMNLYINSTVTGVTINDDSLTF